MNRVPLLLAGLGVASAFDGGNAPEPVEPAPVTPVIDAVTPAFYNNFDSGKLAQCGGAPLSQGNKCFVDSDGAVFRYGCVAGTNTIVTDSCGTSGGCDDSDCDNRWKDHGDQKDTCYNDGKHLYSFSCEGDEVAAPVVVEEPAPAGPVTTTCAELGWPLQPGDLTVCGFSKVDNGKCATGSFAKAEEICAAAGGRLCTAAELAADETTGTGCKADCANVWTSDSCAEGHLARAGAAKCENKFPDMCMSDDMEHAVRCCSDVTGRAAAASTQGSVLQFPQGFHPAVARDFKLSDGNCGASAPIGQYSCWTSPSGDTMRFACSDDDEFIYHQFCGSDSSCSPSSCSGDWLKTEETMGTCYSAVAEGYLYHYACPGKV